MKNKKFSVLTIFCFCSVVLIPIGIALMWFTTKWKTKIKVILSAALTVLYAGIVVLLLLLQPANNLKGINLPGSYNKGSTSFDTEYTVNKPSEKKESENTTKKSLKKQGDNKKEVEERIPNSINKQKGGKNISRWLYVLAFLLLIILLIIRQNLRHGKKSGYENPYVDTNQYKLPLTADSKMPIVHFLHIHLRENEKILFATETTQKDNEGDFVVTNKRVVILNKNEVMEFPMEALTAISSVSNSVIMLTSGDHKYYIFMPENQLKYALAVVRWAFAKATEK